MLTVAEARLQGRGSSRETMAVAVAGKCGVAVSLKGNGKDKSPPWERGLTGRSGKEHCEIPAHIYCRHIDKEK